MKESTEIEKIKNIANEEANSRRLLEINSDMLLLGILKTECPARKIINEFIAYEVLMSGIEEKYHEDESLDNTLPSDKLPDNEEVGKIMGSMIVEFRNIRTNNEDISSLHLLLSILSNTKFDSCKLLNSHEITYEKVRDLIINKPKDPGEDSVTKNMGKKSTKNLLEEFGINLNEEAKAGRIKPAIARDKEIKRAMEILARKDKNNPILVGNAGVGKTAIAEGIAYKIVHGQTSPLLADRVIYNLDLNLVVAGTKFRGQFEERMKAILNTVKTNENFILFIDEFHTAIGAGNQEAGLDVANIIKPALARGSLRCIAATTLEEYRKIEKDPAFDRRLQKILVEETSINDTIKILDLTKEHYAKFHNVEYTTDALRACVELSDKFITNRFFPDKAIDILDEAGACKKLQKGSQLDERSMEIEQELARIKTEKELAVQAKDFILAKSLKDKETSLLNERLSRLNSMKDNPLIINKKDIEITISNITNIPIMEISKSERERINNLEKVLNENLIGQPEPIKTVIDCIKRHSTGLRDPKRPIGSFIFLGQTGVGKTELAKLIAKHYFGDEQSFFRLDMSEYMEKHTISRLIGAPPGYVGYEEGGKLTEAIRRRPYSLVLLDEIEKAHPDIFNIFLQILEDGILTDALGKTTYFKNTIIIMTSNQGASFKADPMGFINNPNNYKKDIEKSFEEKFPKEFINRIDDVVIFNNLDKTNLLQILDLTIKDLDNRLKHLKIGINLEEAAKEFLLQQSDYMKYGARQFKKVVLKHLENLISDELLEGNVESNQLLNIILNNNILEIKKPIV